MEGSAASNLEDGGAQSIVRGKLLARAVVYSCKLGRFEVNGVFETGIMSSSVSRVFCKY